RSKTIYGSPVETSEPYSQNYTQSNDNLNYKIIIRCSTNFVKHCSFLLKINEKIDSLNLIKQSIVIISLQNFRFFSFPYFSCTVANTTLILPSFIIKLLPAPSHALQISSIISPHLPLLFPFICFNPVD